MKQFKQFFASLLMCAIFVIIPSFSGANSIANAIQTKQPPGSNTQFSGRAIAVKATALGLNVVLADTTPLPSIGGALEASLLSVSLPIITAQTLHAATVGKENAAYSEASTANVAITLPGLSINTGLLMSTAKASCTNNQVTLSGNSTVLNLVINGQTINVTGAPNQIINLAVGKVIINEQAQTSNAMTVNALHVVVNGVADIVISSAHADITCGKVICTSNDFVTGGGYITKPSGDKANFGVAGGLKNKGLWGHLVYIDHGINLKVKGTKITSYTTTGATMRRITGTADVNGQAATYIVDVADNGEPGTNDTFSISLAPMSYSASGTLKGGNIQLHGRCQ